MNITDIPRVRRFAIAFVSTLIATVLFHTQIASALVTRGDDFLHASDLPRADRYYERALHLDPHSSVAIERYVFVSLMTHTPTALKDGIARASTFIEKNPDSNEPVRLTRGLCESALKQYLPAFEDFKLAAKTSKDFRISHLAGEMAIRLGRKDEARYFFKNALVLNPSFAPSIQDLKVLDSKK